MNTQITNVLLLVLAFAAFAMAQQQCQDRMATRSCQYFVRIYREKNIDSCKWKQMMTNCALTCKVCEPVPKCATRASRYGCCWDKKTEAKSYAGEGCPECKDDYPSYCKLRVSKYTKEKACNERGKQMCPKSCDVCKIKAATQRRPDCLDTPYGCCWDLTAAQGPEGQGCRVCQNLYNRLCSLWDDYCQPEAYRFARENIIDRYRYSCPITCGKCSQGQKMLDVSAFRRL
ncbi:hypothetical protein ACROYT_G008710 [Oculina patagonica]